MIKKAVKNKRSTQKCKASLPKLMDSVAESASIVREKTQPLSCKDYSDGSILLTCKIFCMQDLEELLASDCVAVCSWRTGRPARWEARAGQVRHALLSCVAASRHVSYPP